MARYGSNSVTITYDDAGGTPRTITGFVLEMGGLKITAQMDPNTPYGAAVVGKLPTGVSEVADVTLEGYLDDTATTGPHAMFKTPDTSPNAATRTLSVVVGGGNTWTSEGYVQSYEVLGKFGNLTKFRAQLVQNSGAWS